VTLAKKLTLDLQPEQFCERTGDGVAYLPLHGPKVADDLVAIGERLQATKLASG
jgi:hypothetical protein